MNNADKTNRDRDSSSSTARPLHFGTIRVVGLTMSAGTIRRGDVVGVRISAPPVEPLIADAELVDSDGKVIPSITLSDKTKIDLTEFLSSNPRSVNLAQVNSMIIGQRGAQLRVYMCNDKIHSFTLKEIQEFEALLKVTNTLKTAHSGKL